MYQGDSIKSELLAGELSDMKWPLQKNSRRGRTNKVIIPFLSLGEKTSPELHNSPVRSLNGQFLVLRYVISVTIPSVAEPPHGRLRNLILGLAACVKRSSVFEAMPIYAKKLEYRY